MSPVPEPWWASWLNWVIIVVVILDIIVVVVLIAALSKAASCEMDDARNAPWHDEWNKKRSRQKRRPHG